MSTLEKAEECPRCGEVKRWLYDAQICAACDYGNPVSRSKHNERAIEAIARHLCSTDMTDGFCGPRDGKCIGQNGERQDHRNCVVKAKGCIRAMATVGVKPVWAFDKTPGPHSPNRGEDA